MGTSGSKTNLAKPKVSEEEKEVGINEITNAVLSGEYTRLDAILMGGNITSRSDKLEDPLKPMKGVATDLVVAEFFSTTGTLYRFLHLVYTTFNRGLTIYRNVRNIRDADLFFIFKGGNILRIIARQFLAELPAYANLEIENFYSQFFKRSDNDFGIYLNPKVRNYDDIYDELSTLSYYLQIYIRKVILADPSSYFDYSRYNDEYKNKILEAWLDKFSEIDGREFIGIRLVNSGPDSTMRFVNEDFGSSLRDVAKKNLDDFRTPMKITHNNALEFAGTNGVRRRFNLTRTKLHFQLEARDGSLQRVPGELIDVSIGHKLDTGTDHFFEHAEDNIVIYTLRHPDTEIELTFLSYSLEYLTVDLEGILFLSYEVPWDDPKYIKRLNRLMYIYFIDIFIKRGNTRERTAALFDFQSMIIENAVNGKPIRSIEYKQRYSDLNISKFIDKLVNVAKKTTGTVDAEQFSGMIQVINSNIEFLMSSLTKIEDYCKTNGIATESSIYMGNFKTFI